MRKKLVSLVVIISLFAVTLVYVQKVLAAPGDLTGTMTRTFPTNNTVGMTFNLLNDGEVVYSKTYTEQFDPDIGLIAVQRNKIIKRAQKDIDAYKVLLDIFMSPAYVNSETTIINSLNF